MKRKLLFSSVAFFVLFNFSFFIFVGASSIGWDKTYGGAGYDGAFSLVETSDGGFAMAGQTDSFGAGRADFWLIKSDKSGNIEWDKTYGGTGYDSAFSLIETSDGGFAMAGQTDSFGAGDADFWLIKTDGSGNLEWQRPYGGAGYDASYALIETSDGGFALAGPTESSQAFSDSWLIKTDRTGIIQWNRAYGGLLYDDAYALVETSDGGFVIAGFTESFGAGASDYWIAKTDNSGNMQWNRTHGGPGPDIAQALVATSDGGFGMAGFTESFGAGNADLWLVKTDEYGIPEFPSWIILPFFVIMTLVLLLFKNKVFKKTKTANYL